MSARSASGSTSNDRERDTDPGDLVTAGVLARLAQVRGEGAGGAGRVRIVLDGTGDLVDLVIAPPALRLSAEELAGALREAFAAAREEVAGQLAERRAPVRGGSPDTASLRALEELALAAHRRLAEMAAFAQDLAGRFDRGPDAG